MKAFQLVHPVQAAHPTRVSADIRRKGALLSALFRVQAGRALVTNPDLLVGESQWGLWDWDVVELFVSCAPGNLPYYEFQVSPLGQHFELEISEPRKRFDRDYRSGLTCSARITGQNEWEAEINIPLDRIGWTEGGPLMGNAFAILGPRDSRTYWSLFEGQQSKPDFHLPAHFRPLT